MTGELEEFLRSRGSAGLAHPGGTLHEHLRRVAGLLRGWGADPTVQIAGLGHACYGTDGFDHSLVDVADRLALVTVIGAPAEALVYLYGSCDRATVYPQLAGSGPVAFRDRFTGETLRPPEQDLRAFLEITAANELDVLAHNPAMAAEHGPSLLGLLTRVRDRLSGPAWRACEEQLAASRPTASPSRKARSSAPVPLAP